MRFDGICSIQEGRGKGFITPRLALLPFVYPSFFASAMAPYFLKNLIPRKELHQHDRPLLEVLRSLTWIQWAQFWCGMYYHPAVRVQFLN